MKTKYPRTYHLPWSPGASDDDKTHTFADIEQMFGDKRVVVTEKLDGENTTIYATGECHARSLDSGSHPSRDYVRAKAREIGNMGLPKGWRLVGENCYAKHSIAYDRLPDFFVLFGVVDDQDVARPWVEVVDWANMLEIPHAPVLWEGKWDVKTAMSLYPFESVFSNSGCAEGFVVRVEGSFPMTQFDRHVAKFVRAGHVQSEQHWMHAPVVPNVRQKG